VLPLRRCDFRVTAVVTDVAAGPVGVSGASTVPTGQAASRSGEVEPTVSRRYRQIPPPNPVTMATRLGGTGSVGLTSIASAELAVRSLYVSNGCAL
jgi:hypothetical protein